MLRKLLDLTGQTIGELTVLREILPMNNPRRWVCQCACGNVTEVIQGNLRAKTTKSCGCLRITVSQKTNTIHGGRKDSLYGVFTGMRNRCNNPNSKDYGSYGGRGVLVCAAWDTYLDFKQWADSSGYSEGLSIDRKDTDAGYSPDNCRWATYETQNRNRSKQKATSSQYIGVSWNKAKSGWVASVKPTEKRVYLGHFANEVDAAKARDNYIIQNNLEDFVLNFK